MKSIIEAKKKAKSLSKKNGIKLKEALEQVAKENNFSTWKDYKNSMDTFWYENPSAFLNHWFSTYEEAKQFQKENSGFLLTYKGQYFIASEDYIRSLGMDPEDQIWKVIGYDVSSANSLEKFFNYYIKVLGKKK